MERRFSADDIGEWCRIADIDEHPEHVPEPLIAGLFSYLLGEELPGHGTNYLKQHMRFERSLTHIPEPPDRTRTRMPPSA